MVVNPYGIIAVLAKVNKVLSWYNYSVILGQ